jgi:regulator of cell morphogenesis and NO signaling
MKRTMSWEDASLTEVVKYLESEHHEVVRTALYRISLLFTDVCHDARDIRLAAMRIAFRRLSTNVIAHMEHEELTVFPAIVALEEAWIKGEPSPPRFEGGMRPILSQLMIEHSEIERKLAALHEARVAIGLTEHATCSRLFDELELLERHLNEYTALENDVAFPRALALEDTLHQRVPKEAAV